MFLRAELIHKDILQRLSKLFATGRLAHAYVFTGPGGIGKAETALALAQAVNCLGPGGYMPGCGCPSCRRILDGNHPDIYIIEKMEDKNELLIEQVRELIRHLSLRPLEARVRTAIIRHADQLTTQASNAFLKTLEEPRSGTLLILTSAAPGNVLKTVFSRCHEVRFFPPGNSVLAERLKDEYDISSSAAGILAKFSGGSPARVAGLGKAFIARKNDVIDEFIFGPSTELLLKKWSSDKEAAAELLNVVLMFYRDVLCVKVGAGVEALYNSDRQADIARVAAKQTKESIEAVLGQAVQAVEALGENFNLKVALTLLKEYMG
ncbi:MAG: DNA polymerase III subunit [Candidatus Omnitrophica bacterium]|nr:DNA polymerase III subunit [Candidatus Omnitrophota bacterium]